MATNGTHSDASGSYRIKPLKGADNYSVWHIQVEDILTNHSLWGYTDETIPCPIPTPADAHQTTPAIDTWKKNDRKALTIIHLRVSALMITYVTGCTTSRAAWEALKNVFDVQGPMSTIIVRRQLMKFAVAEGADIEKQI